MPPEALFEESADDTRTAIMEATYRALTDYGYADLTIQRIADEFDKSKSLLYHHHDGKDDLLVDFLEFALDHFEDNVPFRDDTADERLRTLLDAVAATKPEADEEFVGILVELRAQAVNDDDFRDHFLGSDRFFHDHIVDIIAEGIEEGTFRDVDPEQTASFLLTLVSGAMVRNTTGNQVAVERTRAEIREYIDARLLAD
ncbi:TetR/AcrR family transcriptional regulator [Halorussus caseinilyticus]|uniref:TetR/AcrR family transcriptional regulator n=1 Tax=Halorussus caseinilyticus TaxID=3034025 RepID=A0ABD5WN13_9EURY|nr:TetR/AcrR family transcriptional regulator [Halorussus sp. DT72]